jgi:flagellar L-ring protein precursor FlgH
MRSPALLALIGLGIGGGLGLGACGTAADAIRGPKLSATGAPVLAASQTPAQAVISATAPAIPPGPLPGSTANSLWRPGARAFFIDQRAHQVGDILTVLIQIDDSAKLSNSTSSSRENGTKGGVPHFFGLEKTLGKVMPSAYDPTKMIEQSGTTNSAGTGSLDRQEQISLTVAAVVTGVLPNGNLLIQGSQQVRTNNELRDLTISGMVRPADISSANTIRQTQIAEARIYYGGRGDLSRVQRTPVGQALAESFSPF